MEDVINKSKQPDLFAFDPRPSMPTLIASGMKMDDAAALLARLKRLEARERMRAMEELKKRMTANERTLRSPLFQKACELAGIPATKRQASKFNNSRGIAFRKIAAAKRELGLGKGVVSA